MKKCNKFIKDSGISNRTKLKLIQAMIFSIVLYGCESWTLKIADKRKIDAFKMWTWRRVLKVTWLDRWTNASILQEIKPSCSLEALATKYKLIYFGLVMGNPVQLKDKFVTI